MQTISELSTLLIEVIKVSTVCVTVNLESVVRDNEARAFLGQIILLTGSYDCHKYIQRGLNCEKRAIYAM